MSSRPNPFVTQDDSCAYRYRAFGSFSSTARFTHPPEFLGGALARIESLPEQSATCGQRGLQRALEALNAMCQPTGLRRVDVELTPNCSQPFNHTIDPSKLPPHFTLRHLIDLPAFAVERGLCLAFGGARAG